MLVTPINSTYNYTKYSNKFFNHKTQNQKNDFASQYAPKGLNIVSFGHSINTGRINHLMGEYRRLINENHIPPIKALVGINMAPEELDAMFKRLLTDEFLNFELIHSIVDQKRSSKYFVKYFNETLPADSDTFNPYAYGSIYRTAYEKYIETRVKYARSISELLEIRPDWSEAFLLKKHEELYHNTDFELGIIPSELGKENFESIVNYLRKYMDHNRYKTGKEIPPLNIGNHTFKFYFFTDGKTDKNVFGIKGNHGESFIIKLATPENKGLDKVNALGTLCKIDTYLTRNYCRNSAPIKYYNHKLNASIYDFIEHQKIEKQPTLQEIDRQIPDFRDLGLRYYDNLGVNNFFILDNTQYRVKGTNDFHYGVNKSEWITVDNDSVSFDCKFHPILEGFHRPLPINSDFNNIKAFFV